MRKIFHLVNNLEAGGAQTFIRSLAIEQQKAGNEVSIVLVDQKQNTKFENGIISELNENNVNVFFLERKPGRNFSVLKSIKHFRALLKQYNPDIVNSYLTLPHVFAAGFLKYLQFNRKIKHVMTVQNAPEAWNWQMELLNKKTPTIYCSYAAKQTNPAKECIDAVIENAIIPGKIDDSAKELFDELKNKYNSKFVLSVGRLALQKNYKLLAEIAKKEFNQDVHFLVCGDTGNATEESLGYLNSSDKIHYLGVLKSNEIFSLMSRCDCFLNMSLHEGLPLTVLEAFYTGVPCVLSPILPHFEIGKTMPYCYIADSFDADAFKDKINVVLGLDVAKNVIQKEREQFFEKYKIENAAIRYNEFYEGLFDLSNEKKHKVAVH
jgi:glycosyltransferase involved in cell wall biosynthesis